MKIADFSIKHPAIIGILLITLALFGLLSFRGMKRDLLANIEMPEILVFSVYPGASPETVEREVTEPLEDSFGLISGVEKISSDSYDGYSTIFIVLDWDADIEAKKNDIRDRINAASSDLPDGLAGSPRIYDLGVSSLPVYSCLVESDMEEGELARVLDEDFLPRFSRLADVSAVYARGAEKPAVRIRLDPAKLEAMDITALEAYAAVARGQANVPAGDVVIGADRVSLQSRGDYGSLADVGSQPVGYDAAGHPVFLDDLGTVGMGSENPEFRASSNGKKTVALDVMKRPDGDTETLISAVKELQADIEAETRGRIRFVPVLDDAETIGITLSSVGRSAWLGGLLAALILLLFLHDLRAALIVSMSIPFTIFLTFILMRARGMSLNMMTLAGMTVSIGMIVDSSVVILENTMRHRRLGKGAAEAASLGADEVGGAVLASTSTSLSVFVPILFVSGLAGAILKEVSWTLLFALSSSAITAVVIVPWLSSRLLSDRDRKGFIARFGSAFDAGFDKISKAFAKFLNAALNRKGFVLILSLLLTAAALGLLARLGGELISMPDMNEFEVYCDLPPGYDLDRAEEKMEEIAEIVRREVPEIKTDLWYAGIGDSATIIDTGNPSSGYGRVVLKRRTERERSVFQIIGRLNQVLPAEVMDADITVRNGGLAKKLAYATEGEGFRIEITGTDWDSVLESAEAVRALMEADPLVERASLGVRLDKESLTVDIDKIAAGRLAVDPLSAGRNLRILFAGEQAGTLDGDEASYPLIVDSSLADDVLADGILGRIRVRNAAGETVPYAAFSQLDRRPATDRIPHRDRLPSIVVVGELSENDLAGVGARMEPLLAKASFPPGVSWRIAGAADVMGETFRDLAVALGVAIFLVYAVMVIQFERFTQPLIIMGSVPFVLIGVALVQMAFGTRITMMSIFSIIALGGMVVNNAIVLVDFANRLRREGLNVRDAILDAARIRLKPILITTLTTLLGLIPLAFAMGEGSEIYAPLGQVIAGGLTTSTLITLVVVPVLYEHLERRREKKRIVLQPIFDADDPEGRSDSNHASSMKSLGPSSDTGVPAPAPEEEKPANREESSSKGRGLLKKASAVGGVPVVFFCALMLFPAAPFVAEARDKPEMQGAENEPAAEVLIPASAADGIGAPWSTEALIRRALEHDSSLNALRAEARSAAQTLRGAKAEYGPKLGVELGSSYLSDPILSVEAGSLGDIMGTPFPAEDLEVLGKANDFRYDASLVLEQPVYTSGKISAGIAAAARGSEAAGWQVVSAEDKLATDITVAMESLSLIREMIALAEKQELLVDRLVEITLRNYEEGFLLEDEYRRARTQRRQVHLSSSQLRCNENDLLVSLERMTDVETLTPENLVLPEIDETLESFTLFESDELVAAALAYSTDIKALSALEEVRNAQAGLAGAKSIGRPDLVFRGEFAYGGGYGREPDDLDGSWTLTLGASTTLFDSGRASSGRKSAEAAAEAAAARTDAARRDLVSLIRSTLHSMELNRENIDYYTEVRENDMRRASETKESWESGYGREEEWLRARLDVLSSETRRLGEVLSYLRQDRMLRGLAGLPY